MAWSYDENLLTDKDKVRLKIGDNLTSQKLLSNEEILAELVEQNNDIYAASSELCRSLAARFSREAVVEIGDTKLDRQAQADRFMQLAEIYKEKAGLSAIPVQADSTERTDHFTNDLHLDGI